MTPYLSDRIKNVAPSATMQMTQAARDLRATGRDVISLSVGEPDFDTPDHIKDAAMRALADGHTRYTATDGIPELKDAIIRKFRRDNKLNASREQINVSPGGKAVIWNALSVTVNPNDEVIIPTPCWVSYPDMVRLLGGRPVLIPGGSDFKMSSDQLADAITPRTRWLMLNSPSNPTGAVYSQDALTALADVLRAHPHVMVLSDDIYEALTYEGAEFATLASVAPDLAHRCLTMNGVSKAYAMTGFRIGYGAGPAWMIDAMRKFMGQTTSNPTSISQWAAISALDGPQDVLTDWRNRFATRRDLLCARLNDMGLRADLPPGAFYIFADCTELMKRKGFDNDQALALDLLNQTGVATVPGTAFQSPGHLRISYAAADDALDDAAQRLRDYMSRS